MFFSLLWRWLASLDLEEQVTWCAGVALEFGVGAYGKSEVCRKNVLSRCRVFSLRISGV